MQGVIPATEMKCTDDTEIGQNLQVAVYRALEDNFTLTSTSDFLPFNVIER
jgi:hypothetical protein